MNKFLFDCMHFMQMAMNYDSRDMYNMLKCTQCEDISSFTHNSSDMFKGKDVFGYELFIAPSSNMRVGTLLLMYRGRCVFYINNIPYQDDLSKIGQDFLEVNCSSSNISELYMYDRESPRNDPKKKVQIDINNFTSDTHFNHLLWMDLPDFDITSKCIEIYKEVYRYSKFFGLNFILCPDFCWNDFTVLEFPQYAKDAIQEVRPDFFESYNVIQRIFSDPVRSSVYDNALGG